MYLFRKMVFSKKYLLPGWIIIIIIFSVAFSSSWIEHPNTGFWAMKGTLINHIFEDKTDSMSGPELFELQDSTGLTIWFGWHIFKDVCISGKCKMIRLWVFWDGAGCYLGHQLHADEPLTKSDHTKFEVADYLKLDNILKDTSSVLKRLKQEQLIIMPDKPELLKVDGYTAATQPTLAEVVVKDAVYTCHTLWHTVYGPTQKNIHEILESRLSNEYLTLLFGSRNPNYISWAIKCVLKYPEFHEQFYPQIINCVKSENESLANQALKYFSPSILTDKVVQNKIVTVIPGVSAQMKYDILWKLTELEKVNDKSVTELLEMFEKQQIGVGALNLIFRLIRPEQILNNQEITTKLQNLAKSENAYIRNLTNKLLNQANATK
jgi:hypothetical protein